MPRVKKIPRRGERRVAQDPYQKRLIDLQLEYNNTVIPAHKEAIKKQWQSVAQAAASNRLVKMTKLKTVVISHSRKRKQ